MLLYQGLNDGCLRCGYGHYSTSRNWREAFDLLYVPKILNLETFNKGVATMQVVVNDTDFLRCKCKLCGATFEMEPRIREDA